MYWTVALEGGPRRVNHAAVAVGDKIFSFGGYCNGGNFEEMMNIDVYILDTVTLRWKVCDFSTKDGDAPFQRYGHTVVAYKNKIYLWGGRNERQACNKLYTFDTKTYSWCIPRVSGWQPVARDGHSACVIGDTMYIFAGYVDTPGVYTQEICSLNLETLIWSYITTKEPKPLYRDFHTATAVNSLMYVWGGREVKNDWHDIDGDGDYGSQMYVFDPTLQEWTFIQACGDVPLGRRSHSAVAHQSKIIIFGGFNSKENNAHFNDLFMFDPDSCRWTKLNPPGCTPHPRRRQAFCLVGSKVFLFGGTSPHPNPDFLHGINDDNTEYEPEGADFVSEDEGEKLVEHSDLYVLDLDPSLKTLALMKVLEWKLDISMLPINIRMLIEVMTKCNKILGANRAKNG